MDSDKNAVKAQDKPLGGTNKHDQGLVQDVMPQPSQSIPNSSNPLLKA